MEHSALGPSKSQTELGIAMVFHPPDFFHFHLVPLIHWWPSVTSISIFPTRLGYLLSQIKVSSLAYLSLKYFLPLGPFIGVVLGPTNIWNFGSKYSNSLLSLALYEAINWIIPVLSNFNFLIWLKLAYLKLSLVLNSRHFNVTMKTLSSWIISTEFWISYSNFFLLASLFIFPRILDFHKLQNKLSSKRKYWNWWPPSYLQQCILL